jgi:hypothetical protein
MNAVTALVATLLNTGTACKYRCTYICIIQYRRTLENWCPGILLKEYTSTFAIAVGLNKICKASLHMLYLQVPRYHLIPLIV